MLCRMCRKAAALKKSKHLCTSHIPSCFCACAPWWRKFALELQVLSSKCIQAQSWNLDKTPDQIFWAGCAGKLLPRENVNPSSTPYTSENVHVHHGERKCSRTASTQFKVQTSTILESLLLNAWSAILGSMCRKAAAMEKSTPLFTPHIPSCYGACAPWWRKVL